MRTKGSKNKPKAAKPPKAAKREKFKAPVNTKETAEAERPFIAESEITSGSFLKSLLKDCRKHKENADTHIGSLREAIGYGKSHKKLHPGVFAWLRKLDGMEAEKAAEWWFVLNAYVTSSGMKAKIDSVQRLPMGDPPVVEDEEADASEDAPHTDSDVTKTASDDAEHVPDSAPPTPAPNVSRPRFGQRAPAGISGTDLLAAVGDESKH